jgi:hypothetical protein
MNEPAPRPRTELPANRAFIVQVARTSDAGDPLRGRAEHLASGAVTHFDSLSGLGEFIVNVLGAAARDAADEGYTTS